MHDDKVVCPRCGQDWLIHVRLIHLDRHAIFCPECEALWHTAADVGVSPFEDYETFMIRNGRVNPHTKDEIEHGAPLMQGLN
jgi:transcription elongation factor Elf1